MGGRRAVAQATGAGRAFARAASATTGPNMSVLVFVSVIVFVIVLGRRDRYGGSRLDERVLLRQRQERIAL